LFEAKRIEKRALIALVDINRKIIHVYIYCLGYVRYFEKKGSVSYHRFGMHCL